MSVWLLLGTILTDFADKCEIGICIHRSCKHLVFLEPSRSDVNAGPGIANQAHHVVWTSEYTLKCHDVEHHLP